VQTTPSKIQTDHQIRTIKLDKIQTGRQVQLIIIINQIIQGRIQIVRQQPITDKIIPSKIIITGTLIQTEAGLPQQQDQHHVMAVVAEAEVAAADGEGS